MGPKESALTFNPEGELYNVNKERLVVLGGGRALLMQLAHPLISQGIHDARFLEERPAARLTNTLDNGLRLIFSTPAEAEEITSRINTTHQRVKGILDENVGKHQAGDLYDATNPELLKWVAATIVDSSLLGYETFVGPLSTEQKDKYIEEATSLFEMLNVEPETFPKSFSELSNYIEEMILTREVCVSSVAKHLAPYAMLQHAEPTKTLALPIFKVTIGLLPKEIREQYGFKWSYLEEKLLQQFTKAFRKSVPFWPEGMRYSKLWAQTR